MPALISSKIWFLFIALTVVVVVGSPTTDLLESVDCLLRDCVRCFTNADRNNDRFIVRNLWSAICFKIMTRYTCGFFPRILAIIPATRYTCVFLSRILAFFPALWGFYSQVYDHFLTNAHIYAHQKGHIYALQTSMWYMWSQKVVV